jgi:transposase
MEVLIPVLLLFGLLTGYAAWRVHQGLRVGDAFLQRLGSCETVVPDASAVGRVVAVRGTLAGAELTLDPIDETPCVGCCVTVAERGSDKRGADWRTVDAQNLRPPFELQGAHGAVVTVSTVGDRMVDAERREWSGLAHELPREVQRYLALRGVSHTGLIFTKRLRVVVERLPAGRECTVVGVPSLPEGLPGLRESAAVRLHIAVPEAVTPLSLPALCEKLRADQRAVEVLRLVVSLVSVGFLVASVGALLFSL